MRRSLIWAYHHSRPLPSASLLIVRRTRAACLFQPSVPLTSCGSVRGYVTVSSIRLNSGLERGASSVGGKKELDSEQQASSSKCQSSDTATSSASSSSETQQNDPASEEKQTNNPTSSIEKKEEQPNAVTRVKRMPLTLVEEVPLPVKLMGDLELVMTAWSEEHARQYQFMVWLLRICCFFLGSVIVFFFYKSMIGSERMLRGNAHVPQEMKVGCVVYLDMQENGRDIGRIVIGLLTDICPLYCEYFHRRCTGSGGNGDSFRGLKMVTTVPNHVAILGEGRKMTHGLEGFAPNFLPTEARQSGPWRGCLSSISVAENRESPNFCIHASSADYHPQVFGIVLGGYDVVERMHKTGLSHGANPKRSYVVSNCGELCTLDKANVIPLPWKLYDSISEGYDEERFGPRSDWATMLPTTDLFGSAEELTNKQQQQRQQGLAEAAAAAGSSPNVASSKKPWYKVW